MKREPTCSPRTEIPLRAPLILVIFCALSYGIGIVGSQSPVKNPWEGMVLASEAEWGALDVVGGILALAGGAPLLFLLPGLLWWLAVRGEHDDLPTRLAGGLAVNVVLIIVFSSLYKLLLGQPVGQWSLFAFLLVAAGAGWLVGASRKGKQKIRVGSRPRILTATDWRDLAIPLLVALVLALVLWQKVCVENYNGDGMEATALALSLQDHSLPFWDLERVEGFGNPVVNPYFINSHLSLGSLLLFGETEGSMRVLFFFYLWAIGFVLLKLFRLGLEQDFPKPHSLAWPLLAGLAMILFTLINLFYVGYNPYFVDIAQPAASDAIFTLFLYLEIYFFLSERRALFTAFALLSALVLYSGPVFTLLLVGGGWLFLRERRRWILRSAGLYLGGLLLIVLLYALYGSATGHLAAWKSTYEVEYIGDYFSPNRPGDVLRFTLYFIVYSGGLPVAGFFLWKFQDRRTRVLNLVTLLYLLIVLGSGYKNLHYLTPIPLLASAVFLRTLAHPVFRKRWPLWAGAHAFSALLCVILALPTEYHIDTSNRDFGRKTWMQFESEEEAVRAARIISVLYQQGGFGWNLSPHVWAYYATLSPLPPLKPFAFVLSESDAPPADNMVSLARWGPVHLWRRGDIEPGPYEHKPMPIITNRFVFTWRERGA